MTAEERGQCALDVAAVKVVTSRAGLNVSSKIFDVIGARGAAGTFGY